MKQNYHINDYLFTTTKVYYRGEYLSTFQLAKHLSHWWPGVPWEGWAKLGFYIDLKKCLESKIHIRNNQK